MDNTTNATRYVLDIPGCAPVVIEGWGTMNSAERDLALCLAVAAGMGVAAGLDLMVIQYQALRQKAPHLIPRLESAWPAARKGFVRACAKRGYVRSDEDRALIEAESA